MDVLNQIFHSLCNAEACSEFAGPISASLRLGNTAPFEKNVAALATLFSIWLAWDLNLRPPAPEMNALPLYQLDDNLDM